MMPPSHYRRILYMLKDIERDPPGEAVRRYIEAMAYVNEKLKR